MQVELSGNSDWGFSSLHPLGQGQLKLDLEMSGQLISRVRINADAQHRSDQKLLEWRDFQQGLTLLNRASWLSPASFEIGYAQAAEELLKLTPTARGLRLRQILLQMQLVMADSWRLAALTEFAGGSPAPWLAYRTIWQKLHLSLTGAGVHDGYIRYGGVGHDLPEGFSAAVQDACAAPIPEADFSIWESRAILHKESVLEFGLTGVPVEDSDAMTRASYLRSDLLARIDLLRNLLIDIPSGPIGVKLPKTLRVPVGSSFQQVESAMGGVSLWLHSDGDKAPLRVALHSNSQVAVAAFQQIAVGREQTDAKLLLATLPIAAGEISL